MHFGLIILSNHRIRTAVLSFPCYMALENREGSEKALSFFSKHWVETHRGAADHDFKLMSQKMESLKGPFSDLANSFNREWENFKKSSLALGNFQGLDSSSELNQSGITNSLKNSVHFPNVNAGSSRDVAAFWKPPQNRVEPFSIRKSQSKESLTDDLHSKDSFDKLSKVEFRFPVDWKEIKHALEEWQNSKKGKQPYSLQEWEPLRRLRVGLMELETALAASLSPRHFFDNLAKTEFFEETKKTLELAGNNMTPLNVRELLEGLVLQSKPLLDQLGVKSGFAVNICTVLRNWEDKRYQLWGCTESVHGDMMTLSREAGDAAKELDLRIASILNNGFRGEHWGGHALPTESLSKGKPCITIATTASLPWMTGTAINPLLRAAYLARDGDKNVTLLVPWLSEKDQRLVYPNQMTFECPQDQEKYIRDWLSPRISFQTDLKIAFYPGKFSEGKRSILAVDDITRFIPQEEADIAILEEPEHLTWYHHGARWTQKFRHVVGVVHTNYLEYVKREKNGPLQAFFLKYVNNWVTNIYCHRVIRLSAATQNLPKSVVCNVHGVSPKFLEIGRNVFSKKESGQHCFTRRVYFLGKMVWGKGYRELIDLWAKHKDELNDLILDVFGNGEDSLAIKEEAKKQGLQFKFHQGIDHADSSIHEYKVFINPSISDVVCTTTAEALAMGKIVVCADHPSNDFFKCFPNCYTYKTSEEFVEKVKQAMNCEPLPLSVDQQYMLSWEAATERFLQASGLDTVLEGHSTRKPLKHRRYLQAPVSKMNDLLEHGMFLAHYCLSGIEIARWASGAIPGTIHMDQDQQRDLGFLPASSTSTKEDMMIYL